MKKTIRFLSALTLAATVFSASAAPQVGQKLAKGRTSAFEKKVEASATLQPKGFQLAGVRKVKGDVASQLRNASHEAFYLHKAKAVPSSEIGNLPDMIAMVTFSSAWSEYVTHYGLYKLPKAAGEELAVIAEGPNGFTGVLQDGVYYVSQYQDYGYYSFVNLYAYDATTGATLGRADGKMEQVLLDCTTDPVTGTIYSIGYNSAGNMLQLAKLTPSVSGGVVTLDVEPISELDGNWNSIACDATGQLYGIAADTDNSTLCKIDKTNGAVTAVGQTGVALKYLSSSEIETRTGRMFWTVCTDEEGYLAEVDLNTGVATKLFNFVNNEEVQGLCIIAPEAEDEAPAAVTDLEASFPFGSLTGTVNFTAPTTLFNGTEATGELTYQVLANGNPVANGTTSFGSKVEAPVTVKSAGSYTFVVTVSNEVGRSPKQSVKAFVGNGVPAAPVATLEYSDGKMNLSWTPVTTSANEGYVNPDEVTYTVTRFPDNVVVATDIKTTSFTEAIAEPDQLKTYYYEVVAKYDNAVSEAAVSNSVVLGYVLPPYSQTFDLEENLEGFTLIDANNDGCTWSYYDDGVMRARFNSANSMDDWLITPPLKLEGGKVYQLSFDTYGTNTAFAERIEVKMGLSNTAEAMTTTVFEPTDLLCGAVDPMNMVTYLAPETSGTYFIGFHGISDADKFYLYLDNLSVGAASSKEAPSAVTNLQLTNDPNGEVKATISFNAPDKNLVGQALSEITKIEISRDGELVHTFSNPQPGAALSFVDTPAEGGIHSYEVVPFNSNGEGHSASISGFVGVDIPAAPASASIVETNNLGEVTVSWEQVSLDKNGNPINPALVKYLIGVRGEAGWTAIFDNITGTSKTFQAIETGEPQDFVQYAVFAQTSGGIGDGTVTNMIPVGEPYNGLSESFADCELSYVLGTERVSGNPSWGLFNDANFSDITSLDGDNGFLGMRSNSSYDESAVLTGKVSLAEMNNPILSFYTFNIVDTESENSFDDNIVKVCVKVAGDADFTELINKTVTELCGTESGWKRVNVDLSAYAGKTIQVKIVVVPKTFIYTFFDNLRICPAYTDDLRTSVITAPEKVKAGEPYSVDVTVFNDGISNADDVKIDLYADGELVDSKTIEKLASGEYAQTKFDRVMHILATEPVELYAFINYPTDEVQDNNTTRTLVVNPKVSSLPAPLSLKAELTESNGVELTWDEPVLEGAGSEEITESFESADAGAMEYEGWTFVDVDNYVVGGIQGTQVPGITAGATTASFFVFDSSLPQFNETYAAHSGDKFLAAMFRYDDGTVDDWAISPVLDGNAQTVSFYAKSYHSVYKEKIEIYYSTGSTEPSDFIKLKDATIVPNEWTLYTAQLPKGAMHFAIRSCATSSFMLMVDDVNFNAGSQTADLSLLGYNIYRDGVKINTEPVEDLNYSDAQGLATHKYQVTALYEAKGESSGSNIASPQSGVNAITDGVNIFTSKELINVTGADNKLVTVTTIDGKLLYSAKGDAAISVVPGIYVVKVEQTVAKVLVK